MQRREEKNRLRMKSNCRRIVDLIAIRISASAVSQAFKCTHIIANGNCPRNYTTGIILAFVCIEAKRMAKKEKKKTEFGNESCQLLLLALMRISQMLHTKWHSNFNWRRPFTNNESPPPPPAHFLRFLFPYCVFESDTHLI